jgi:beta-mannosidase
MSRRILNLNGSDWQLGQAPASANPGYASWDELQQVAEWLPATVPGNVRADLDRAGRLPELSFGTQAEASQWADDHCWWLAREFTLAAPSAERMHLVLRGVDYIGDLFLNGHHLGRHEGMFSPQVHDVTALLRTENRLAVRILGSKWLPADRSTPWLRFLNDAESRTASIAGRFPQRRDTLKCQMGFGWDFAPPLRTMGIWDDVYAVVSGNVFLRDVAVQPQAMEGKAHLIVYVELDTGIAQAAEVRCTLVGETFESAPVVVKQPADLVSGASRHRVELSVPRPRLWWPWDHGRPDLYHLVVEVWDGARCLDSLARTIGLRQVELEGWTLRINGRRVYARGANWVPADILPGRITEADYLALLSLARGANMNLLRVWGGGLREKRAFYDLCDRLGILVWQEFPLACAFLTRFPRSPDYLGLVADEARAIVRDLRSHPSVVLWCGGNEFSPKRNAPLVDSLRRVVASEDPSRPFLPASPGDGDSHNWRVWHNFHPPAAYRDDPALFASEFGLQALPDRAVLERFIPPEDLWPPGASWAYHGAEIDKLWRYAHPFLQTWKGHSATSSNKRTGGITNRRSAGIVRSPRPTQAWQAGRANLDLPNLETCIQASQCAQANALQIAIEHYRRRKAQGGGGVLVWQLNEPWPAISWALLDHYRQPKPAYDTVKRLFAPLLVSLDYPLRRYRAGYPLDAAIWVLNDRHQSLEGCQLEVVLWDEVGMPAEQTRFAVDVTADSAERIGHLHWILPPGASWRLTCSLVQNTQTLAGNEYDLSIHDGIRPTVGQRLWAWLSGLAMP